MEIFKNVHSTKIMIRGDTHMKKRFGKKGAMELSMNTIVIVVIGITLLVLGLVFVRGIFTKLGGLGGSAFQKAEQELKQIQAGDSKINFPASIDVKKGKSANTILSVCNIDGTLNTPSVELGATNFPVDKGLSITVAGVTLNADGIQKIPSSKVGEINYQMCRPFPVLVSCNPNTVVDPSKHPFLEVTVKSGTQVYDSTGTLITII